MAKFKTVYDPRTKTKSVVAFTAADSDEFVAAIAKKEELVTKRTTKDSDGTFELMHRGSTKLKTDAAGIIVSGTVTGTTFSGSGASLTSLNASKLSSGTVPSARLSLSASDIPNLATSKITSGTFDAARIPSLNASKITAGTIDSDRLPTGTFGGGGGGGSSGLDSAGVKTVQFNDNEKQIFGTGDDLEIYHDGSSSYIRNTTNFLNIRSQITQLMPSSGTEVMAKFIGNGAAELYHNNVKKLETTSTGTDITGTLGVTTVDLGNWTITESSGVLYFATGGTNKMKLDASGNLTVVGNVTAYGTM